ncbi:MAG: hypothetical protein IPJ34_11445 [Myxococcales bacterium]|nr:hypothetical protein [Myxococcales bacterium]
MIQRLRTEADATEDPARKAVLLHEAAELEERVAGDELGAAREYLAAYNLDAGFREPLEALVRILERRRSLKNLGRVLDSLSRSADTTEERARAFRARAADAADVRGDREEARQHLEQALDADPADATAWLMMEIEAALRGDADARKSALARRVELSGDPRWAALLRVDLAELRAADGDVDDALDVLTEVITSPDEAAFHACEVGERLARKSERSDREAWTLAQRGDIILESLEDPPSARGRGVPRALRRGGVASDAFVRAASAYRSVGRIEDELSALDRAIQVDPTATMPQLARIAAAVRLGDIERAGVGARELIERSARPELAPQLWFTVAEAALSRGDRDGVIEACAKMLETSGVASGEENQNAPTAVLPKTLLTDLLLDGSDPKRLADLLTQDALSRPTPEGRTRGLFVAAASLVLFAGDLPAARATLELATSADPLHLARLERALAGALAPGGGEDDGFTKATEKVRARATNPVEISDADFDRARAALARGDRAAARAVFDAIAEDAPRRRLVETVRLALGGDDAGDALLRTLAASTEEDPAVAFAVARAMRAARKEDEPAREAAVQTLGEVAAGDTVASLTRALAALDRPSDAAQVLADLAASATEPRARDALRIAAGLLHARAGKVEEALEAIQGLETEADKALAATRAVWQRYVARNDEEAHRAALETTGREVFVSGGWSALERVTVRLAHPEADADGPSIDQLLAELAEPGAEGGDPALVQAGILLRAYWPDDRASPDTKQAGLAALAKHSKDAGRWVARSELRSAMEQDDPVAIIATAEKWLAEGGGVPAALEALLGADAATDTEAEIRARLALARALDAAATPLEGAVSEPRAAAADYLRLGAAMTAHVAGLPRFTLRTLSSADPDLVTAAALAEAELAPPGADPVRREHALRGLTPVIEGASATLHEMAAWSALAREDHESARALFARALELFSLAGEEPRSTIEGALETELLAAGGNVSPEWAELVERLATLAEKRGNLAEAVDLWERVGHAWWDRLANPERGELALSEAFTRDRSRRAAFDRVFRAVRSRKEDDRLLEVVSMRLESTDDPPEMAKLFWERARVLRAKGDRENALAALDNVTMLEPDHVGALALSAEIHVGRQAYAEAASALDRLSRQPVPVQQKVGAGLGAADLYEQRLDAPAKALDVLVALDKAGISDVAIHERIARAAARAESWVAATTYLTKLVSERVEADGRVEAARLCAAIYRDRLDDPQAGVPVLVAWLREVPEDPDAIEQLLDAAPAVSQVQATLQASFAAARAILQQNPADVRYARIVARIAALTGNGDLHQLALSVVSAMGAATPAEAATDAALSGRLPSAPSMAFDDAMRTRLVAPEETGPILDLFRVMGPTIAEALGPTLDALDVGRRERLDPRAQNPLRNEIAAWAGAVGIAELEVYVTPKDPQLVQGVPAEMPAIVIGSGVKSPLSLTDRARVLRELFAITRGTTITLLRDDVTVAAIIVASCAIGEVSLQTPPYAVLAETQRLLQKAIARKTKKLLPELAQAVSRKLGGGGDLRTFRSYALKTLDRAAVLAAGSPAASLSGIVGEGARPEKIAADTRAQAMLRFVWTDDYLALRKQLGLSIG